MTTLNKRNDYRKNLMFQCFYENLVVILRPPLKKNPLSNLKASQDTFFQVMSRRETSGSCCAQRFHR